MRQPFGIISEHIFFSKKKICSEIIPKGCRIIYTTFSAENRPISPLFEPIFWHVWWNLAVLLDIPCSENSVFLKKNWSQRHPKRCKRLPTSSKCHSAIFLIIFYGGSHTFHSDPRMRSMPNCFLNRWYALFVIFTLNQCAIFTYVSALKRNHPCRCSWAFMVRDLWNRNFHSMSCMHTFLEPCRLCPKWVRDT